MLDFSQEAQENDTGLIPDGQLAYAYIKYREYKAPPEKNAYLDLELTIAEGQPYGKRKLWPKVMDYLEKNNSEGARNMGLRDMRRILNTAFGATPDNPDSYKILADYHQLNGAKVPILIRVKKDKDQYGAEREGNEVEFLCPYSSDSTITKAYQALVDGATNIHGDNTAQNNTGQHTAPTQQGFQPPMQPPHQQPPMQPPMQPPVQQQQQPQQVPQQAMQQPPVQQQGFAQPPVQPPVQQQVPVQQQQPQNHPPMPNQQQNNQGQTADDLDDTIPF